MVLLFIYLATNIFVIIMHQGEAQIGLPILFKANTPAIFWCQYFFRKISLQSLSYIEEIILSVHFNCHSSSLLDLVKINILLYISLCENSEIDSSSHGLSNHLYSSFCSPDFFVCLSVPKLLGGIRSHPTPSEPLPTTSLAN